MARGENPGQIKSFPTDLTYSATTDFGHAAAGKNRAISLDANGKAILATNNSKVIGTLLDVGQDEQASVMVDGWLIMLQDAVGGVNEGDSIVGGGQISSQGGYIQTAAAAQANIARGTVWEILSNTAGGRVLVQFP